MKFGKKNTFTKVLYSQVTIAILFVLCVLLGMSVWERLEVEREMAGRAAQAESELNELTQRKEDLGDRVEYLAGERGVEEEIRKNFDVVKEGEQVIILMGEDVESVAEVVPEQVQTRWYQFWK